MIFIILAWFLWFLVCLNLGYFVLVKLFNTDLAKIDIFYYFWFGLFCLITFLQIVSLFYPLNTNVLIGLIFASVLILALNIRHKKINMLRIQKNLTGKIDFKKILIFGFILLVVSLIANLPVSWYDSLLYHFNSVKWIVEYGTVRGLANLHFPLAYNNSTFILAAIMDNGFFRNSSAHIMNSFLFAVFFIQIISYLFKEKKNILAYIFGLFSLLILSTYSEQINSLSTDLGLAVFFLLFNFYVIVYEKQGLLLAVPILILAAASKFSAFAVLGLFVIFLAVILKNKNLIKKNLLFFIPSLMFFAGFIARNYIMSGWPFYPLKFFGVGFPWQVPPSQIQIINDGLKAWGRLPGKDYMSSLNVGFWNWFVNWFYNNKSNYLMFYAFLLIPILIFYLYERNKTKRILDYVFGINKIDFLIFANLATLIYSFTASPDFRYMGIYIVVPLSLILSVLFADAFKKPYVNMIAILIFTYLVTLNIYKAIDFSGKKFNIQRDESSAVNTILVKYPDQSFNVLVPVNDDRCGNSELPCAPHASGFKMFQPNYASAGYYSSR